MAILFSNNAATTLSAGINGSVTSAVVVDASEFPAVGGADYAYITFASASGTDIEIVKCTAISGNTLTVVRAQDGTSGTPFITGDRVELRVVNIGLTDLSAESQPLDSVLTNTTASYTTAEAGKLAAIEALADVTDATNVNAAGAVMNSDATTAAMSMVVDEDAMSSNSDTKLSTQQSVVAYIASQIASVNAGIFWKAPVVVRTTGNITLSGEQTIDGVLTSTSRVLVMNQTSTLQNGIYISAAGAWARAVPMDTWDEHVGAVVSVSTGSLYADISYRCTVDAGGTLETTAITWVSFVPATPSATDSVEGTVELLTNAEVVTGTDTTRAMTAAGAAAHYSPEARTITADTSTALNSALIHEGGVVTMSNASANVFTIEPNATIAHSTGAQIDVIMLGAGVTSITADTGVTLNGVSTGTGAMTAQYGAVTLLRISSDVWTASGAIGTVA